jgi:hypothetical protein
MPELGNRGHRDVVAHELAHVAARSTQPRFHGGPANPEERRARRVGQAAAGIDTPGLAALGVDRLPVGGGFAALQPDLGGEARQAGTTATDLLAAMRVGGSPAPAPTAAPSPTVPLQRATSPTSDTAAPRAAVTTPAATAPVQRFTSTPSAASTLPAPAPPALTQTQQPSSPTALRDQFEAILEALEERVLADLERRGGRFAGEF